MTANYFHNKITPTKLYYSFINGNRLDYTHDEKNDKQINKLNMLAEKYKKSLSIEDKKALLEQERKILYEELVHPELTLARNYRQISELIPVETQKNDVVNLIHRLNLVALERLETLKKIINQDVSVKMFSKVIKSMNALDTTTYIGMNTKNLAESLASFMTEKIPVSSKKVSKFLNNDSIKLNMKINLLVDNSSREINADELLGMLKNTAKEDYLQNTALVNRILKSKSVNPQIYRLAVWGAGRFRNDENFEIIKNIALDVTEKDIRKREFAIHSLALYLKDKPSEVRNILGSIENDNTDFSMLAKILNDKIHGRYHGKKNRELLYLNMSDNEIKQYNSNLEKYVENEGNLNTARKNILDKNNALFRHKLKDFIQSGGKFYILNDTLTKVFPEYAGKRYYAYLNSSGDFFDSFDSYSTGKINVVSKDKAYKTANYNVLAHENGHILQMLLSEEDSKTLQKLYENILGRFYEMGEYAQRSVNEYFAEGFEAMSAVYKPHKHLIESDTNTIYKLMSVDKKLYDFLKYITKKYR